MTNGGTFARDGGRDWVAIILAIGIATAINLITAAVLYDAIFSQGPGLSENATQILIASFGGMIGVLGSYIGFRAGNAQHQSIDHEGKPVLERDQEAPDPNE